MGSDMEKTVSKQEEYAKRLSDAYKLEEFEKNKYLQNKKSPKQSASAKKKKKSSSKKMQSKRYVPTTKDSVLNSTKKKNGRAISEKLGEDYLDKHFALQYSDFTDVDKCSNDSDFYEMTEIEKINSRRARSRQIATHYKQMAEDYHFLDVSKEERSVLLNRYLKVSSCSSFWLFDIFKKSQIADFKSVNLCNDKFCTNCSKVKQAIAIRNHMNKFTPYDGRLFHVALTVPNVYDVTGIYLKDTVDRIIKAFQEVQKILIGQRKTRLSKYFSLYGCEGAFRTIEITHKGDYYHPHLHVVFAFNNLDLSEKKYKNAFSNDTAAYSAVNDDKEERLFSRFEIEIQNLWFMAYNQIPLTGENFGFTKFNDKFEDIIENFRKTSTKFFDDYKEKYNIDREEVYILNPDGSTSLSYKKRYDPFPPARVEWKIKTAGDKKKLTYIINPAYTNMLKQRYLVRKNHSCFSQKNHLFKKKVLISKKKNMRFNSSDNSFYYETKTEIHQVGSNKKGLPVGAFKLHRPSVYKVANDFVRRFNQQVYFNTLISLQYTGSGFSVVVDRIKSKKEIEDEQKAWLSENPGKEPKKIASGIFEVFKYLTNPEKNYENYKKDVKNVEDITFYNMLQTNTRCLHIALKGQRQYQGSGCFFSVQPEEKIDKALLSLDASIKYLQQREELEAIEKPVTSAIHIETLLKDNPVVKNDKDTLKMRNLRIKRNKKKEDSLTTKSKIFPVKKIIWKYNSLSWLIKQMEVAASAD